MILPRNAAALQLKYKGFFKYLGLQIDNDIKFDVHIETIKRKLARAVGRKIPFPKKILLQFYHALIFFIFFIHYHLRIYLPKVSSKYYLPSKQSLKTINEIRKDFNPIASYNDLCFFNLEKTYKRELCSFYSL